MADFPLFIKMDGRKVMVIGGGSVALRKIRILTDYGADIRIISREVRDELKMLAEAGRLEWQKENLTKKHLSELDEAFLVICASNDETVNAMAADYCQKLAYTGGLCQTGRKLGLCVPIGGPTGQCSYWYQYIRRGTGSDKTSAGENRSGDAGMVW